MPLPHPLDPELAAVLAGISVGRLPDARRSPRHRLDARPGTFRGFDLVAPRSEIGRRALSEQCRAVRQALAGAPPPDARAQRR